MALGAAGAVTGGTADGVGKATLNAIKESPGTGPGKASQGLLNWLEDPTVGGAELNGFSRLARVGGGAAAVPAVMSDIHDGNSVAEAVTREGVGLAAGLGSGAAAGALIGSVVPGAGTAVGVVVGADECVQKVDRPNRQPQADYHGAPEVFARPDPATHSGSRWLRLSRRARRTIADTDEQALRGRSHARRGAAWWCRCPPPRDGK